MGTRVPPPVVMLAVALLMWLAARRLPPVPVDFPGRTAAAVLLGAAGLAAAVAGALAFRRARTTLNPLRPDRATALVAGGIFRCTRNPMYLGDLLVLLGWGVYLGSLPALILSLLFVIWIDRWQIPAEEAALEARFGEAYATYRRRVRRWI